MLFAVAHALGQLDLADVVQHRAHAEVEHLGAPKPKLLPISSEITVTLTACAEALSPAASVSRRMHSVLLADHLVDKACVSASACWRGLLGWRDDQSVSALAGARGFGELALAHGQRVAFASDFGAATTLRGVRAISRGDRCARRAERPAAAIAVGGGGDGVDVARRVRAVSGSRGRFSQGSSARASGRANGWSRSAPRRRCLKLLSGNGCDIQPTSRCTNIPTRSVDLDLIVMRRVSSLRASATGA